MGEGLAKLALSNRPKGLGWAIRVGGGPVGEVRQRLWGFRPGLLCFLHSQTGD